MTFKTITLFENSSLELAMGQSLSSIEVAYQTYGKLNSKQDNVILICHALTGDSVPYNDNPLERGWWQDFIGPGLALDTERYFFVCSNVLGGCYGTTGPASFNPKSEQRYASQFPFITVQDIVRVQKALLDKLGIKHLYAVIGGSFGGMQANQWAIEYPDVVERVINLCSSLYFSAEAIGFNHVMRQAIVSDPNFNGGDYYEGEQPYHGMRIARMVGMLTYRTDKQLDKAFGRSYKDAADYHGEYFQVESYLTYQGDKFFNRFDANSYILLTRALDLYDPSLHFESSQQALERISAKYTLVAVKTDQLFRLNELQKSKKWLEKAKVVLDYHEIHSDFGHDAFLVDYDLFAPIIKHALES